MHLLSSGDDTNDHRDRSAPKPPTLCNLDNQRTLTMDMDKATLIVYCSCNLPTVTAILPSLVRHSTKGAEVNPDPRTRTRSNAEEAMILTTVKDDYFHRLRTGYLPSLSLSLGERAEKTQCAVYMLVHKISPPQFSVHHDTCTTNMQSECQVTLSY